MFNVTIVCVGKLKERYLAEGCGEYQKRLGAFCKLHVVEIAESRLPDRPSDREIAQALEAEGAAILAKIPPGALTVAMCIEGKLVSSPQLAALLEKAAVEGKSAVAFVIGGSFGLSEQVKQAAAVKLSMSPMTFPHQLARMLLLEQVYRAFSINNHSKYHK